MNPSLGIAITTHNRRPMALETVRRVLEYRPPNSRVVVVDDGSDEPFPPADGLTIVRHDSPLGIARAKNRCLAELDGCDYLMLLDDDCRPVRKGWMEGYADACRRSDCQHFCLSPGRTNGGNALIRSESRGGVRLTYWNRPFGVGLFYSRKAVDMVGGFDPRYGRWGGEHIGLSWRIYNAKLTPWPFVDVLGASERFEILDADHTVRESNSTVEAAERRRLGVAHKVLVDEEKESREWKPYREG